MLNVRHHQDPEVRMRYRYLVRNAAVWRKHGLSLMDWYSYWYRLDCFPVGTELRDEMNELVAQVGGWVWGGNIAA